MLNSVYMSNLRLCFALSRTTHALLDMTAPALVALLWLGHFPSLYVVCLGLITAFAGYTAVYAFNDLVDCRVDRERMTFENSHDDTGYLDTVVVRHPVAAGLLSFRAGLAWALFWSLVAFAGSFLLGTVCAIIFLVSIGLETLYCRMARISHLRILVSGLVKTSGPAAAIFAVDPSPSVPWFLLLLLWFFFWEIGGQNIPADWFDMDEDRELGFDTVPVHLGTEKAGLIATLSLSAAVVTGIFFLSHRTGGIPFFLITGSIVAGLYLLILPVVKVLREPARIRVMILFNRASLYPAALLGVTIVHITLFVA